MNRWEAIKQFYEVFENEILSSPSDEWAIPAYSWDCVVGLMTPIEDALWHDIREANAVFYPQWPVAGFFVDFANPVAKVILECDGKEFHKDKEKDRARDAKLRELGWTIYRFPGWLCFTQFDDEEMKSGEARQRIDEICRAHPVQRNKKSGTWYSFGQKVAA